jgi:ribose-phosphate pyrophosphokinase
MELIGDVKGKNVILVDDMIDTEALWRSRRFNDGKGALSVRAICTHAILSGGAYEK